MPHIFNEEKIQLVRDDKAIIHCTNKTKINPLLRHIFPNDESDTTGKYKFYSRHPDFPEEWTCFNILIGDGRELIPIDDFFLP